MAKGKEDKEKRKKGKKEEKKKGNKRKNVLVCQLFKRKKKKERKKRKKELNEKSFTLSARDHDLREHIPHTWASSHDNLFQSNFSAWSSREAILGTISDLPT